MPSATSAIPAAEAALINEGSFRRRHLVTLCAIGQSVLGHGSACASSVSVAAEVDRGSPGRAADRGAGRGHRRRDGAIRCALPGDTALASSLGISIGSVTKAYAALERRGLVRGRMAAACSRRTGPAVGRPHRPGDERAAARARRRRADRRDRVARRIDARGLAYGLRRASRSPPGCRDLDRARPASAWTRRNWCCVRGAAGDRGGHARRLARRRAGTGFHPGVHVPRRVALRPAGWPSARVSTD